MADRYEVQLLPDARRQLGRCVPAIKQRLKTAIDGLATDPRPAGVKPLKGLDGILRIRVGEYRILYRVFDERLVVLVLRVGHRREMYRGAALRRLRG